MIRFVERQFHVLAPALFALTRSRVIDQNMAHDARRDRKKMDAVFPTRVFLINQFKICFVNQSRRLQSMLAVLAPEMLSRDAL